MEYNPRGPERLYHFLSFQWHLGYFTKEYTPLYRGFDSFFGFLGAKEDYYDHSSFETYWGYDLRDNMTVGKMFCFPQSVSHTIYKMDPFTLYVLFTNFTPRYNTLGSNFFQMSPYARANVRITCFAKLLIIKS